MSDIVARARACVGARFRPQGRDPATGLDCVGVVAWALRLEGLPRDYALRGGDLARVAVAAMASGCAAIAAGGAHAGDAVLLRTGPGQLHLAVLTGDGFVHADAGLGRVVERPGAAPWPVLAAFRRIGRKDR